MRFHSFIRGILVGLFLQAAIMGLDAERLLAQPVHLVPDSLDVPAPQVVSHPAGCNFSLVSLRTSRRFGQHLDYAKGFAAFGEFSHRCLSVSNLFFNAADLTENPRTSSVLIDYDARDERTLFFEGAREVRVESRVTQRMGEWTLGGGLQVPIPIPIQVDYQSWMGIFSLGGSTFPTTTTTLHYEPSPWVLRYWSMDGTYVDHATNPPSADPTSGWGVRLGYVDRDAMYYTGYDWLDYGKGQFVHAGPVIGVQWGSPLQYDVTIRLPYMAKLGSQYEPALGLGVRAEYHIPLGEAVSLRLGYQTWNYWFYDGWHYWDGLSISLGVLPDPH